MLVPALSAHDPAAAGEGSRDPLGLEAAAERLAASYLPAVTSRMSRIRALTVLALAAHVCDPMHDDYTADETAPAWLVFEWMWAEATAAGVSKSSAHAIPGIETTRRWLNNGERLSSRNYVKGATALGLHGFYRTLAEDTLVLDGSGFLDEGGERLLRAWAEDQGLDGLLDVTGAGGRWVRALRRAVRDSLEASACAAPKGGQGMQGLRKHLGPAFNGPCRRERAELRSLLEADERRRAVLAVLAEPGVETHAADALAHAQAVADEAARRVEDPYPEIAAALRALIAFERFGTLVTTAFDLMRHRSTEHMRRPVKLMKLTDPWHEEAVQRLPRLIADCDTAFAVVREDSQRAAALDAFRRVWTPAGFLDALLNRHEATQRAKRKLAWFEAGREIAVRGPYALTKSPSAEDGFLHPTRLPNAAAFIQELEEDR